MASGQTRELEERETAYRARLRKRMLEAERLLKLDPRSIERLMKFGAYVDPQYSGHGER